MNAVRELCDTKCMGASGLGLWAGAPGLLTFDSLAVKFMWLPKQNIYNAVFLRSGCATKLGLSQVYLTGVKYVFD